MNGYTKKADLKAEALEARTVPAGFILDAPEPGEAAVVRVLDGTTGAIKVQFDAFPGFTGGLTGDASNDRNGDGLPDRIAVGIKTGGPPHVKVFDGSGNLLQSFFAYDTTFLGGVDVGLGDVNDDGVEDVITGALGGNAPHVKAFDGRDGHLLHSFLAFDAGFRGGVNVDDGDTNNDGADDIIVGAAIGAAPHVKVFNGRTGSELQSFYAYDGAFVGGVRVSGGDLNGDGRDDIVTGAGPGAGSHVKVFRGDDLGLLSSKIVFEAGYAGGVDVFVNDSNGNGSDDLIVERTGLVRYRAFDDNGVDGPFHDLYDDVYDDNGGASGGGSGSGNSGGITGTKVEGTVVAVNAAAGQVAIRTRGGTVLTVAAAPGAKIERNDLHTTLAAFKVGDLGEALLGTTGLALKIEAYGA
ncbi:MAG: hypothetical protein FJ304_12020 [Planctomycetes bacterium]|nr:hypothetical protein [Planctomycetota bacterium]